MIENEKDKITKLDQRIESLNKMLEVIDKELLDCAVNMSILSSRKAQIQKEEAEKENQIH
ncbi:hypothetical protein [Dokdonia sp.]|uniref:hypothetical protein n=1 Tax=Dokdonia sp. TaxID=2024995 RepID=UPI0032659BBF